MLFELPRRLAEAQVEQVAVRLVQRLDQLFVGKLADILDFVLRHDKKGLFRFTPAQSPLGTALMRHYGFRTDDYETSLLIESGVAHIYSESVLRVVELLGGTMGMTATFMRLVPRFIRDAVYRVVARNRMKIAGRRQTCRAPSPEERERFL